MSNQGDARLRNVACPSCGAPVRFRGATSVVAVCPFCSATLVREGVDLRDIGKQAQLLEDHSPIRIGAEGRHRGVGFTVVGCIQYKYGAGVWNEWHVLFPGSKGGPYDLYTLGADGEVGGEDADADIGSWNPE